MNKKVLIGLGVLAVAGIGLYVYNKRKKGEKTSSLKGDMGFGSHFGSSSADGETEMASEDVRDCGCKYKDTDDSTVFSIARPKYSNALGKFSPRRTALTDMGLSRTIKDGGDGTGSNLPKPTLGYKWCCSMWQNGKCTWWESREIIAGDKTPCTSPDL